MKVGGSNSNTFLDLTGNDTLDGTVDGDTKTLDGTSNHRYVATFDVDAGGTEFSFAFLRGEEDDSAPASVVELPEPFALEVTTQEVQRTVDDVEFSGARAARSTRYSRKAARSGPTRCAATASSRYPRPRSEVESLALQIRGAARGHDSKNGRVGRLTPSSRRPTRVLS